MNRCFKKTNAMRKVGTRVSALFSLAIAIPMALSISSCDRDCPKPATVPEKGKDAGIEVLIEYENTLTGETRAVTGDSEYSFEKYGDGGIVEAYGLRFYEPDKDLNTGKYKSIKPQLTFYAQENVAFQGWSWRYADDPVGTHRDAKGNITSDFVATPSLQTEEGLRRLDIIPVKTCFTCNYRPGSKYNRVYVKVKYKSHKPETLFKIADYSIELTRLKQTAEELKDELKRLYAPTYMPAPLPLKVFDHLKKPGIDICPMGPKHKRYMKVVHLKEVNKEHYDYVVKCEMDAQDYYQEQKQIYNMEYGWLNFSDSRLGRALNWYLASFDAVYRDIESMRYEIERFTRDNPSAEYCWYNDTGDPVYFD